MLSASSIPTKNGFGIIEILVALGLFTVISTTGLTLILHSFSINRLGQEQTTANNLASSGRDIVNNIRSQNFSNLVNGTYGLRETAGVWNLSPNPETWDKYTRTITIADAYRDGSGNLATSGTLDPNTKKITTTVSWNTTPTRNNSAVLTNYLTNFTKTITNSGDALLVWGDTTTTPKWNYYTQSTNLFGTKQNTLVGSIAHNTALATNPTKKESIFAYTNNTGVLRVLCFDGSAWTEDWSATVGGTGTTRRFDVAYEKTSGDAMVVYSTNTATTNELGYRTKSGSANCGSSNWSTANSLNPAQTSGIVHWVKLAEDLRNTQNILALAWADANSDLSSLIWSGTTWSNEPTSASETNLERVSTSQDVESFDLAYESVSGNLMLIWGQNVAAGANGVRYRRCTGGTPTCTWSAITTPPTWLDDATNLDLSSNPTTNEMVFASIGNAQSDLQTGYWSGSTWTNTANRDTSSTSPFAGSQKVATGWLTSGATTRSIVVYDDSGATGINWYVGSGGTLTLQTDFVTSPVLIANPGYYQIEVDPKNPNQLMFVVANSANDLFAKRLVMTSTPSFTWTNSDSSTALETNLSRNTASPFSFKYWRN